MSFDLLQSETANTHWAASSAAQHGCSDWAIAVTVPEIETEVVVAHCQPDGGLDAVGEIDGSFDVADLGQENEKVYTELVAMPPPEVDYLEIQFPSASLQPELETSFEAASHREEMRWPVDEADWNHPLLDGKRLLVKVFDIGIDIKDVANYVKIVESDGKQPTKSQRGRTIRTTRRLNL